jgi:hypothetical protein
VTQEKCRECADKKARSQPGCNYAETLCRRCWEVYDSWERYEGPYL